MRKDGYNVTQKHKSVFAVRKKGFTLIEILLVLSLLSILSGLTLASFSQFRARKTLDAAVEAVFAAFSRAQLDTISSKNDQQYGVRLHANEAIYFVGTAYATSSSNVEYKLHPAIEITGVSLNGGGQDVVFDRLLGTTAQYGTFIIRARNNPNITTTMTVSGAGAVALQ